MKHLLSFVLAAFFSPSIIAQTTPTVTVEPAFYGDSPKAIRLPLPEVGPNASRKSGIVSVGIIVNESGQVSVTDDGDGPYPVCKDVTDPSGLALRAAAVQAARYAEFSPAIVDGQPRNVSGRLNYKFGSPDEPTTPGHSAGTTREMRVDRITKLGTTDTPSGVRVADPNEETRTTRVISGQRPETVSGGVLNGKANALPKPTYPAAAQAVRAGGAVSVQVLIYEDGSVYTAAAVSGHPLLRRASEIAACSSRFPPTLLDGHAVKVAGVITYNFVP